MGHIAAAKDYDLTKNFVVEKPFEPLSKTCSSAVANPVKEIGREVCDGAVLVRLLVAAEDLLLDAPRT